MKSFPQFDKMLKLEMACWIALYGSQFFLSFFEKTLKWPCFTCFVAAADAFDLDLLLSAFVCAPAYQRWCCCCCYFSDRFHIKYAIACYMQSFSTFFFLLYLNYAHSVLSLPAFSSFMLAISGAILCKCAYCMHHNGKWKHFFPPCNGMDALSG